ncbi:hypothetical protein GGH94_001927 [Coemansia aciculifera]|uniref:Uncharacterized protein n=2 Tax=Coemansia TaxID=4863 RepID=A0A9W8GSM2_9FUNG|nr:hypothetical protein GGI19_003992 [Coemansia pectinata]KAJ2865857.1 hypothetical protein GGH94_001927 [Coemansia aciculifera]KAJ2875521.1 hypothetical protein GGH93_001540 [Coemansia aciculifera]KAJ2880099.1 hypothetical protein H4R27_004931 [Coemansia aciculifera]
MAARNVTSLLKANPSQFEYGKIAASALATFGPPEYMGSSLDNLLPPGSAAVPMPGVALGEPAKPVAQMTSNTGEIKTLPISKDEPQSQQYYIAYGAEDNKVLWFQVKVDDNGNEILADHGLKEKPASTKKD